MTASGDADAAILARTAHDVVAAIGLLPAAHRARSTHGRARTRGPCQLMPHGGIAVDVGANVRFFAYALADIADRVFAFKPNPDYAFFARWMLRGRAEVREIALSDASGRGTLYVPLSD